MLGAALVARMYQLQILESDRYAVLAEENRINLRLLAPLRGRILDRFGVSLADNRRNYRVVVVPEQAGDLEATLRALGELIELGEAEQRRVLREAQRKHAFVPVVVRANLSWQEVARIEVAIPELPGVSIEEGLIRNYPYGAMTAHVLGYVAAVSEKELTGDPLLELPDFRIGKSGVEKSQDERLRGLAGASEVEVNAYGRVVRELSRRPGQPGEDVVLGLDMAMQEFVARRVEREPSVACVLLDAATGDVLALVSSPSFDPMQFSTGLTHAAWQELSTDPAQPADRQGDRPASIRPARPSSRSSRWPRSKPGSSRRRPRSPAPAISPSAMRPSIAGRRAGTARCGCATRSSSPATSSFTRRRGGSASTASPRWRAASASAAARPRHPRRARRADPEPRVEAARPPAARGRPGETLIAGIGQGSVLATPLQLATMAARLVTGRAVVPRLVRDGQAAAGRRRDDCRPLPRSASIRATSRSCSTG